MGMGGLWNLSFCQQASAHVFVRSSHRAKNLVQFLDFRKYFHNFKYNNFLFGRVPWIIHMYIWLSFICSAPLTEKWLEEIGSRSWKRWGLKLKSHTLRLRTGLGLLLWDLWTIMFLFFGVLTLRNWKVWPASCLLGTMLHKERLWGTSSSGFSFLPGRQWMQLSAWWERKSARLWSL